MAGYKDLNEHEMSAIIGFWRMGNEDIIIALIIQCKVWQVEKTIKEYKFKHN